MHNRGDYRNMKRMPEIVTYAGTEQTIEIAIEAGADHLVLEDPKLSIRSYLENYLTKDFERVISLAKFARSKNKNIDLSFNLDILPKEKDFPVIELLLKDRKSVV